MEEKEISRCTGHCCENFVFTLSPAEVERLKAAIKNNDETWKRDNGEDKFTETYDTPENNMILDMVIFKGEVSVNVNGDEDIDALMKAKYEKAEDKEWFVNNAMSKGFAQRDGKWIMYNYTCKHFDTETRNCKVYEQRPNMCRTCPSVCNYKGCTRKTTEVECDLKQI